MSATAAILANDARGVTRDNVMLLNIGLSFAGMVAITIIGAAKADTGWADWFPFLVIMALLTNPPGYGFLFGLLMVDERDTGVRSALAVTPLPASRMLLARCAASLILMIAWPLTTVYVMNATWKALHMPFPELLGLVSMLAIGAPLTAVTLAAFASNKVEALAIFKGVNLVALAPLALYFIPSDAPFRPLFLIAPPAWAVFAFDAFRTGQSASGWLYLAGGAAFLGGLLALCLRAYLAGLYKTEA
jgi:hypothetical protein